MKNVIPTIGVCIPVQQLAKNIGIVELVEQIEKKQDKSKSRNVVVDIPKSNGNNFYWSLKIVLVVTGRGKKSHLDLTHGIKV
jgi:hypothetical protein